MFESSILLNDENLILFWPRHCGSTQKKCQKADPTAASEGPATRGALARL